MIITVKICVISVWLGASDRAEEGNFTWASSGRTIDAKKTFWRSGQPDNNDGREDCVHTYGEHKMNDWGCDNRIPFLCQMGKSS